MLVLWLLFSSYYVCFTYLHCWAVVRVVDMIKAYKILIGKPETKNPFAKSSLRCEDISKKDLKRRYF